MVDKLGSRSAKRWGTVVFVLVLLALPAVGRSHRSEAWARSQFATAERLREALNGRPVNQRTRREYQRVIENYKCVYFGAPTSSKAAPSVVAVAELMVEMGRGLNDDNLLRSAIKQYEFLRREYPGNRYRVEALFTIGEIYKDDLNDPARSRDVFEEFLRRYPHTALAAEAREALAEPARRAGSKAKDVPKDEPDTDDNQDDSLSAQTAAPETHPPVAADRSKPTRVTGVRHWSTPDYTRVAIDLEQEVKYVAQRIGKPDRIYFDLLDTKLASTLVGKTFEVDDGFLKKVRVAQFTPVRTRIVLEVDDIGDYSCFLLPDPARLIIDIHGKQAALPMVASRPKTAEAKQEAATDDTATADAAPKETAKLTETSSPATTNNDEEKQNAAPVSKDAPGPKQKSPDLVAPDTVRTVRTTSSGDKIVQKKIIGPDESEDTVAKVSPPDITARASSKSNPSSGRPKGTAKTARATASPDPDVHEALPTAGGDRSLIRALGLKIGRIVIDPGHGGHDTGTIGPNGLQEKDLVLDVALRLGKLLQSRLGAEVVFTRKDDTFVPLETRTAIANQEQADLFVSVHANSSNDPDARGVETYYLNFTSSSDALEVASRENAVSDKSIHELQDLVKKIALKEKIDESREFASDVQHALYSGLAVRNASIRDRGVKKAPFIVLIGANMPSILAEISFVSNPGDERRLRTVEYRQKVAESLYRGISKYVSGLSGVRVASRIEKSAGQ